MDFTEEILKNKRYRERINKISSVKLSLIANDPLRALEEASKGIQQEEPDKVEDVEYLHYLAEGMQKLAQKVLETRSKK